MTEPDPPPSREGGASPAEIEAEALRLEAEHRTAIASIGSQAWRALNRLSDARVLRWKTGMDERDALKLIFRREAERRSRGGA